MKELKSLDPTLSMLNSIFNRYEGGITLLSAIFDKLRLSTEEQENVTLSQLQQKQRSLMAQK